MPILSKTMLTHSIPGTAYGFSATRPTDLGATEYTLVAICADTSSSVHGFADDIRKCIVSVVESCRHSPRADNLMLRVVTFDDDLTEIHGFEPLTRCKRSTYDKAIRPRGCTALFDATLNAVESVLRYGKDLSDHDFDVNAILFVITDGMDNRSSTKPSRIAKAIAAARRSESLESVTSVLIGVDVSNQQLSAQLRRFEQEAKFDRYLELGRADPATLARLARFVSKSISVQSQSLSTGQSAPSIGF